MTDTDKEKRKFGPAGSIISPRDIYGWTPTSDPDASWELMQRIKVPPLRLPRDEVEISAEEFKEILEHQRTTTATGEAAKDEEMTTDMFFQILNDPYAEQRRKARTQKERMMDALEYFGRIDENYWNEQQITLLRIYDSINLSHWTAIHNAWARAFTERVLKIYKRLRKKDPILAKQFANYAWKLIEKRKPKKRAGGTQAIIDQLRRSAIRGDTSRIIALSEELRPVISGKPEKPTRRTRKKEKKDLPDGKVPFPEVPEDEETSVEEEQP